MRVFAAQYLGTGEKDASGHKSYVMGAFHRTCLRGECQIRTENCFHHFCAALLPFARVVIAFALPYFARGAFKNR